MSPNSIASSETDQRIVDLSSLEDSSKLDKELELMEDRAAELAEFLRRSPREINEIYKSFHVTKTSAANEFVSDSERAIYASYNAERTLLQNLTRMMMHYTRFKRAWRLLRLFEDVRVAERGALRVLDYGCGAADYGLAFALHGYQVSLSDLAGTRLDLAMWRFARRGLTFASVPISETLSVPALVPRPDIILTADVLEHVPNVMEVLSNFHMSMPQGGYLWISDFPMQEKAIGGQHLENTAARRKDAVKYLDLNFDRIENRYVKYLFRRR